jgi:ankyrin repeat protein
MEMPTYEELLVKAIWLQDKELVALLLDRRADVNKPYELDGNPLYAIFAAAFWENFYGDPEILEMLCNAGTSLNIQHPEDGMTPLMHAASLDDLALIDELLYYGADPDLKDWSGRTFIDYVEDETIMADLKSRGYS